MKFLAIIDTDSGENTPLRIKDIRSTYSSSNYDRYGPFPSIGIELNITLNAVHDHNIEYSLYQARSDQQYIPFPIQIPPFDNYVQDHAHQLENTENIETTEIKDINTKIDIKQIEINNKSELF
jgi:hypothetical protein